MLFCSSVSYLGAASASCSSSGELEPWPPRIDVCPGKKWLALTGRCVGTNQNPPTNKMTKINGRIFMASEKTFPYTYGCAASQFQCRTTPHPYSKDNFPSELLRASLSRFHTAQTSFRNCAR